MAIIEPFDASTPTPLEVTMSSGVKVKVNQDDPAFAIPLALG